MRVQYIKLNQNGIVMYLIKLSVDELIENSIIERYDSGKDTGYQRQPIPAHYRKISKYFMESTNAILPTAVLAAINPKDIEEIDDHIIDIKDCFRIVDGQHRIKGIQELKEGYNSNSLARFKELEKNFEFPIILLTVPTEESVMEVDAFININNKGKKVNTNLAKQLSELSHYKTHIQNNEYVDFNDELVSTSATRIIEETSETIGTVWYNNVILGDAVDNRKPISINAFSKAIKPIVYRYLSLHLEGGHLVTQELYSEETNIRELLIRAWNIVIEKWPECFYNDKGYNINFNICKGIGVFPLYGLLAECIENDNTDNSVALDRFEQYLLESEIVSSDWLVGGRFTGMSSGQAIKKIIKAIKNEQSTGNN